MKPKILKAGLPLALSVAAFIIAKIMERRNLVPKASSFENQVDSPPANSMVESVDGLNSACVLLEEGEGQIITNRSLVESSEIQDPPDHEEEILALRRQIEHLQEREWELAMRFLCYCEIKEQESRLLELRSRLLLEIARVEFLNWEVSLMEAENKRHEDLVVEYLRVVELLEFWKLENRSLHREVKKLAKKTKQQSRVIRDCNLKIEGIEKEISRNQEELERRTTAISKLDNEVRELQATLNQVQEEKHQLSDKLKLAEKSAPSTSKSEAEGIAKEDYNQLVNELERLHKDRAAEVKELVYLRWSNACLRHELMRNQKQPEQNQESSQSELDFEPKGETGEHASEHELEGTVLEPPSEPCLGVSSGSHISSKRPKILQKLRRWVDGSEKIKPTSEEGEEHEIKCFGKHCVLHKAEEHHVHKNNALTTNSLQLPQMELSLLSGHQLNPTLLHKNFRPLPITRKRSFKRNSSVLFCQCSFSSSADSAKPATLSLQREGRRALMGCVLVAAAGIYVCDVAGAVSTSRRALRGAKIPESDYTTLPNGLKYYDLKVGGGLKAVKGSRVAVHYVAKWKGITFMTSRQGLGVGGGTPYGFDVGQSERGSVLKGLDLGVEGMKVGGQRLLIVPPELAYGSKGVQEIPPNATIELDVELLAIKQSPFGTGVKIIEG
ncbi:hypothetical protein AAG906_036022 [Vitis piasezkii]